jgi:hypothetical protein
MYRVEAQEVRVGLDGTEIVDADHLDIPAAGLGDCPKHVSSDATKPVDCNPDSHLCLSFTTFVIPPEGDKPSVKAIVVAARFSRAGAVNVVLR